MSIEIGILISILGVVIALQGYQLNKKNAQNQQLRETKKDTREETKEEAEQRKSEAMQNVKLQIQLEYISKGVDEIRIDIKSNEKQMAILSEKIVRVEESSKQAHKRLDKMEGKGHEN